MLSASPFEQYFTEEVVMNQAHKSQFTFYIKEPTLNNNEAHIAMTIKNNFRRSQASKF